eukprot:CAMPEP_0184402806 /NCGR_PEP_ID=MMETSP0007-20130409/84302_1 /TAXON_ID=97485 /ORGANISM="Prymnesium parvum, Strain Texoma1" /LENGTH=145 /DNA_ID=CAMNT_0026758739 /DNA_START=59 /DNA_END=492 /DNA_ORIENTATION=-
MHGGSRRLVRLCPIGSAFVHESLRLKRAHLLCGVAHPFLTEPSEWPLGKPNIGCHRHGFEGRIVRASSNAKEPFLPPLSAPGIHRHPILATTWLLQAPPDDQNGMVGSLPPPFHARGAAVYAGFSATVISILFIFAADLVARITG